MLSNEINWQVLKITEFGNYASSWDKLNVNNNNQSVLSAIFIQALVKHFSTGQEQLILGWHNNTLVFGGIFEKLSRIRWRTFQPSQAPLGALICDANLLNFNVFSTIAKLLPSKPLLLDLTQIDSQQHPLPLKSHLFTMPYISTGSLPVPISFDDYFANFSKNTRQNFNKARNRLTKLGVETRLEIITNESSIKEFVSIYGDIESSGWKNTEGTAIHIDNKQGGFYSDLLASFAVNNETQIWCYYFNKEIVAVDLCVSMAETLVILKTTYKEKHAKFSPSLLMKLDAYKRLGQEGKIKTIEYFGKTKGWHKRLQCEERDIYHITWCKYPLLFTLINRLKN